MPKCQKQTKNGNDRRCGQMVSVLAFYSDDLSLTPTLNCLKIPEKTKKKWQILSIFKRLVYVVLVKIFLDQKPVHRQHFLANDIPAQETIPKDLFTNDLNPASVL